MHCTCLALLVHMICCIREARLTKPHRFKETLLWKWCKILTAIGAEYLSTGPAMMLSPAQPEVNLTVLTARDCMVGYPKDWKCWIFLIYRLPWGIRVFRITINHRMLTKRKLKIVFQSNIDETSVPTHHIFRSVTSRMFILHSIIALTWILLQEC
jgi:hypothetical protein